MRFRPSLVILYHVIRAGGELSGPGHRKIAGRWRAASTRAWPRRVKSSISKKNNLSISGYSESQFPGFVIFGIYDFCILGNKRSGFPRDFQILTPIPEISGISGHLEFPIPTPAVCLDPFNRYRRKRPKVDASIFDTARRKKEKKNACPLLDVFACGQVSSPFEFSFQILNFWKGLKG